MKLTNHLTLTVALIATILLGACSSTPVAPETVESWEPTTQIPPLQCSKKPERPRKADGVLTSGLVRLTLELRMDGTVSNYWIISASGRHPQNLELIVATITLAKSCRFKETVSDAPRRTDYIYTWSSND